MINNLTKMLSLIAVGIIATGLSLPVQGKAPPQHLVALQYFVAQPSGVQNAAGGHAAGESTDAAILPKSPVLMVASLSNVDIATHQFGGKQSAAGGGGAQVEETYEERLLRKAKRLLRKAKQGDARAQYTLGLMYANGEGVQKDFAEACRWWRKSHAQGYNIDATPWRCR